jgi:hypothetical protein
MLSFDSSDNFDDNLTKFLEHAKELDPTQGQILSDLAAGISSDDLADRTRMRMAFNAEVVRKLDERPIDEAPAQ